MDISISPGKLCGEISAPPSKSAAHRALICAALSQGKSRIDYGTDAVSADISATVRCLEALGAKIGFLNGVFFVDPIKKLPEAPLLDCGESASTLRFLLPVVCALGCGAVFSAGGRLPKRPTEPLIRALRKNGAEISDGFPLKVSGKLKSTSFEIPGNISSQFASGILFALAVSGGELKLIPPVESAPYIKMTANMLHRFGAEVLTAGNEFTVSGKCRGTDIAVEGDWSNSLFWLASGIKVNGLDEASDQGDRKAAELLDRLGGGIRIDASDIPDAVPVLAAAASTADGMTVIENASRLRLKESDRLASLTASLSAAGADIRETSDGLIISGKPILSGGTADSSGDHRVAFALALAAQKCENGVIIKNAGCVEKSYPDFFEKLKERGGKVHVLHNG